MHYPFAPLNTGECSNINRALLLPKNKKLVIELNEPHVSAATEKYILHQWWAD
jgi:hypothetical protein